jgi:hypothetical protein
MIDLGTHPISEWNTNDLAQGNVSLLAKVRKSKTLVR